MPSEPTPEQQNTPQLPPNTSPIAPLDPPPTATTSKDASNPPSASMRRTKADSLAFFDKVKAVPEPDWGTRAFIYVYCLEPICNLKVNGEDKYLVKYHKPIFDVDGIMHDYGSGKYRLHLVVRKAGVNFGDQQEFLEVEICNPQFPPKIARAAWYNDPRNARWAAMLPEEKTKSSTEAAATNINETFKTFVEIQKATREMNPPPPPPPPAPPQDSKADPLRGALDIATAIMQMRADNPMVEVMKEMLAAQRQEAAELRSRLEAVANKPTPPPPDPLGEIDRLSNMMDRLKKLLVPDKETEGPVSSFVRAAKTGPWDLAAKLLDGLAPAIPMIAARIISGAPPNGAPPPMNGTNGAPGTVQFMPPAAQPQQPAGGPQQQTILQIVQEISPRMVKWFGIDAPGNELGQDFASWVFDGWGSEVVKAIQGAGPDAIVAMYQASPWWQNLRHDELKFRTFVKAFCEWKPENESPTPETAEPEVIDLSSTDTMEEKQHAAL